MQRHNLAGEYDLAGVTARMEAMAARRRKWQSRNSEDPEKPQLAEREATCGFELAPADLSSGGSDADSDGGCQSNSTSTSSLPSDEGNATDSCHQSLTSKRRTGRGNARRLRVTDSLDLSMSVATSDASKFQAEAMHCSRADQRATFCKVPGKESQQRPSPHDANSQAQPEVNAICKPSRIPKLVQQRRQLQADKRPVAALVHPRGSLQAQSSVVTHNIGQNKTSPLSRDCLSSPEPSKPETLLYSTGSPVLGFSKPNDSKSRARVKTSKFGGLTEEIDFTTAEEQRLLQSLEKLDRRLTSVSAQTVAVREGGEQVSRRERLSSRGASRARGNSESSKLVCTANCDIDEETLRTAAYGGGTHCKLRQPSSVSVRSSSIKRAELSSGVHKARVRVGGAFVNDTGRNSSTDGSGKHKILVKKELAHLLF
ncbi:hypothetical protein PHYPSEUDO_015326 [Phytophthora pseudosyringae]|uniref:Uncharacterized protein n=1 Tax=Phytophthora pseudosyringae TaxID=221518 RepID=A0A8T1W3H5_9STRA|nr:hypothetical protein PHYPSEUDO_015326 [Phytophthora pseudosyringae]